MQFAKGPQSSCDKPQLFQVSQIRVRPANDSTCSLGEVRWPEDTVFQSLFKSSPMRENNVLVRQIKPAAKTLSICRVNWQVLRRSFAT